MKKYYYKGYTIRKGLLGWFAQPERADPSKDRWGFSPNMNSKESVENWIDEQ